jgi:hypothetical protein
LPVLRDDAIEEHRRTPGGIEDTDAPVMLLLPPAHAERAERSTDRAEDAVLFLRAATSKNLDPCESHRASR